MIKVIASFLIVLSVFLCLAVTPDNVFAMMGLVFFSAVLMTTGLFLLIFSPEAQHE